MTKRSSLLAEFDHWFNSLKVVKANQGPAKGTIAASLVVLERLQNEYILDWNSHVAPGGAQVKGASGKAVDDILRRFGEKRQFVAEGGRTNRGLPQEVKLLLGALKKMKLEDIPEEERKEVLISFQSYLVNKVLEFHNRQKIKLIFDPQLSTWQIISNLLQVAQEEGKGGPVAQHLVGAKLQLRFPDIEVSNLSYSTADVQTQRQGDFIINDTVFHVTVSPSYGVFEKCRNNVTQGLKVYLLILNKNLVGTRQIAEALADKIAIESLESFISNNVEELSVFESGARTHTLASLIDLYNKRVDAAEIDKSLMIELPPNLYKAKK